MLISNTLPNNMSTTLVLVIYTVFEMTKQSKARMVTSYWRRTDAPYGGTQSESNSMCLHTGSVHEALADILHL